MNHVTRILVPMLALLMLLTACTDSGTQAPVEWPEENLTRPVSSGTLPTVPDVSETPRTEPAEPEEEPLEETLFTDLDPLSRSLNREIRAGNRNPEFQYCGTEQPDAELFAKMTCSLYVRCDQREDRYQLECMPYPGDRMVEAWKNGTESSLSSEEQAALQQAVSIVEQAKKEYSEQMDLELALHDWLCDHIVYNDSTAEISDPENPPRYLTALGALLDGSANCQGYTDGFYVLASLAGFQTDRMSVSGGGTDHIVNTIELDGNWYVVDVTYDDLNDEVKEMKNHRLFNAGKDLCQEYSWEPWMEYRPVAQTSDDHYFYYLPERLSEQGYPKAFYNLEELGESVLKQYREKGRLEQELVLLRGDAQKKDLDAVLEEQNGEKNPGLNYQLFCTGRGNNTFFYIRFAE